jgi:hypothetical protein
MGSLVERFPELPELTQFERCAGYADAMLAGWRPLVRSSF